MRRIRQTLQRLQYAYFRYRSRKQKIQHPSREYLAALVKQLHPVVFKNYRPEHGMSYRHALLFADIGATTAQLKLIADRMQMDEVVDVNWFRGSTVMVTIDEWVGMSKGFYVSPAPAVAEYKAQLSRVIELVLKHREQTVGIHAANWRLMRSLFLNLEWLTHSLVRISHEC